MHASAVTATALISRRREWERETFFVCGECLAGLGTRPSEGERGPLKRTPLTCKARESHSGVSDDSGKAFRLPGLTVRLLVQDSGASNTVAACLDGILLIGPKEFPVRASILKYSPVLGSVHGMLVSSPLYRYGMRSCQQRESERPADHRYEKLGRSALSLFLANRLREPRPTEHVRFPEARVVISFNSLPFLGRNRARGRSVSDPMIQMLSHALSLSKSIFFQKVICNGRQKLAG